MDAIVLRNPAALGVPEVQRLLKAAIAVNPLIAPGGFDTLGADFIEMVQNPDNFLILGAEGGHFKALLMGFFPVSQLFPYPTITLIYNEGSKALRELVTRKYIDMKLERGYTQTLAINASGSADEAWLKALQSDAYSAERIGSMYLFEVK
jgi:hypothetical protein